MAKHSLVWWIEAFKNQRGSHFRIKKIEAVKLFELENGTVAPVTDRFQCGSRYNR